MELELGCGNKKTKDNVICIDMAKNTAADILCNIDKGLPFKNDIFDKIYAFHILEHIDNFVYVMEELWRVSKNDAEIFIKVPHCSSYQSLWIDPTHKRAFSIYTFDYFSSTHSLSYYSMANFKVVSLRLHYSRDINPLLTFVSCFLDYLANLNTFTKKIFERFVAGWFGGFDELRVTLKVVKNGRN